MGKISNVSFVYSLSNKIKIKNTVFPGKIYQCVFHRHERVNPIELLCKEREKCPTQSKTFEGLFKNRKILYHRRQSKI